MAAAVKLWPDAAGAAHAVVDAALHAHATDDCTAVVVFFGEQPSGGAEE